MTTPDEDPPQPPRRKRMTTVPPRVSTTTPGVMVRIPGESGPIRQQTDVTVPTHDEETPP